MRGEFYRINELDSGIMRKLAPGLVARIFPGDQSMLSIVAVASYGQGPVHQHAEEQWGMVLAGGGVRVQDGVEVIVRVGDFWRTPGGISHGFKAGPDGATLLDIFSPPRPEYARSAPWNALHRG